MFGWSIQLWILISRISWPMNRISPSNIFLGIFLRAHRKLVGMCLLRQTVPNCPSSKYLMIWKSLIEIVGWMAPLEFMRLMAAMVRMRGEEQVVDEVVLRHSAILSDLAGLSHSRVGAYYYGPTILQANFFPATSSRSLPTPNRFGFEVITDSFVRFSMQARMSSEGFLSKLSSSGEYWADQQRATRQGRIFLSSEVAEEGKLLVSEAERDLNAIRLASLSDSYRSFCSKFQKWEKWSYFFASGLEVALRRANNGPSDFFMPKQQLYNDQQQRGLRNI